MTAAFRVDIENLDGDVAAANLIGELDQASLPAFERAIEPLIEDRSSALLVDLSDCEFIDSSGLAALVAIRERVVDGDGRRFRVCCPDAQVRRVLELTGLDEAMGVASSRQSAIDALTSSD